jgi:Tfp pilus assembly protein PilN
VIRTNLSTRPFYNERVVHLALIALAVVVVAASAYNVTRILRYSRSDTRLATQASRDEARARDLRQQAARERASVDLQQVELASIGARQANELIDRRTFSWTELLNRFEATLPDQVRITSVRPRVDRERGILLRVIVMARGVVDVNEFQENLDANGAFKDPRVAEEHFEEETGLLVSTMEMGYVPTSEKAAASRDAGDQPAAERAPSDAPGLQPNPPPTPAPGAAEEAPAAPAGRGTQPPPTTRPGRGGAAEPAPATRLGRGGASR